MGSPPWIAKPQTKSKGWSGNGFYQSLPWIKLRNHHRKNNPLCAKCAEEGKVTPMKVVDHIIPIKAGGEPLSSSNLQSLCISCHNRKSALERFLYGNT